MGYSKECTQGAGIFIWRRLPVDPAEIFEPRVAEGCCLEGQLGADRRQQLIKTCLCGLRRDKTLLVSQFHQSVV